MAAVGALKTEAASWQKGVSRWQQSQTAQAIELQRAEEKLAKTNTEFQDIKKECDELRKTKPGHVTIASFAASYNNAAANDEEDVPHNDFSRDSRTPSFIPLNAPLPPHIITPSHEAEPSSSPSQDSAAPHTDVLPPPLPEATTTTAGAALSFDTIASSRHLPARTPSAPTPAAEAAGTVGTAAATTADSSHSATPVSSAGSSPAMSPQAPASPISSSVVLKVQPEEASEAGGTRKDSSSMQTSAPPTTLSTTATPRTVLASLQHNSETSPPPSPMSALKLTNSPSGFRPISPFGSPKLPPIQDMSASKTSTASVHHSVMSLAHAESHGTPRSLASWSEPASTLSPLDFSEDFAVRDLPSSQAPTGAGGTAQGVPKSPNSSSLPAASTDLCSEFSRERNVHQSPPSPKSTEEQSGNDEPGEEPREQSATTKQQQLESPAEAARTISREHNDDDNDDNDDHSPEQATRTIATKEATSIATKEATSPTKAAGQPQPTEPRSPDSSEPESSERDEEEEKVSGRAAGAEKALETATEKVAVPSKEIETAEISKAESPQSQPVAEEEGEEEPKERSAEVNQAKEAKPPASPVKPPTPAETKVAETTTTTPVVAAEGEPQDDAFGGFEVNFDEADFAPAPPPPVHRKKTKKDKPKESTMGRAERAKLARKASRRERAKNATESTQNNTGAEPAAVDPMLAGIPKDMLLENANWLGNYDENSSGAEEPDDEQGGLFSED